MNIEIAKWQRDQLDSVVERLLKTYQDDKAINHIDGLNLPQRQGVYEALDGFFRVIYPGYMGEDSVRHTNQRYFVGELMAEIAEKMADQITKAFMFQCRMTNCESAECGRMAADVVGRLMEKLPELREVLKDDIAAAYEGDPAASSFEEICTSYPFITVITTHRIAHELYCENVPLIPRIMSERSHSVTGVDIHPGAQIGRHFFIDHGTGVVIGETTNIGNNVKMYQGVTLGALSFKKDASGAIVKGGKRHPTIQNSVTIYAGATILGGETVIGEGATIGGNTWITSSVPAGAMVVIGKDGQQVMKNAK
ncbi:MAG: serine acetyltransferase [Candidatus Sumerlaeota bacterium]|nr:serine acetyltransferase [Candidatus Sumerlaeota bacterium]